jgi:hypothetical protein
MFASLAAGFQITAQSFVHTIMRLPTDDPQAVPWSALYQRGRTARDEALVRYGR